MADVTGEMPDFFAKSQKFQPQMIDNDSLNRNAKNYDQYTDVNKQNAPHTGEQSMLDNIGFMDDDDEI